MPELPEVETVRSGLESEILGDTITDIVIREQRLRFKIPSSIAQLPNLHTLNIRNIERRGKYLLISTPAGTFIIHLGMSGKLRLLPLKHPVEKHDHVDFVLKNKRILRYTDPRRFGVVLWTNADPSLHPLLIHLGIEPLNKAFNSQYLFLRLSRSKCTIKNFIMNAKVVVGVGNIYANEALFNAKILPSRQAKSLTLVETTALVSAIKKVLKNAIKSGGTTLRDFSNTEGNPGYFSQKLYVYGRSGQPCFICQQKIISMRINQRSTFYCRKCQH